MPEDVFIVQKDWYSPTLEALPFTSPFRVGCCLYLIPPQSIDVLIGSALGHTREHVFT